MFAVGKLVRLQDPLVTCGTEMQLIQAQQDFGQAQLKIRNQVLINIIPQALSNSISSKCTMLRGVHTTKKCICI